MQNYINQNQYNTSVEQQYNEQIKQFFENFLNTYEELQRHDSAQLSVKIYHKQAQEMVEKSHTTLYVNFRHLMNLDAMEIIQLIYSQYYKFEPVLLIALHSFMYNLQSEFSKDRKFSLSFFNLHEVEDIWQLKTEKLGRLIQIKGTVTKSTEVRPELVKGNFQCKICNQIIKGVNQQFKFTQPKSCINKQCTNQTQFSLVKEGSIFDDWQKIKLQENSADLPSGAVPRSIDVILREEQVEKAQPGDRVLITGTLIVVPDVQSMLKPGEKNELSKQGEGIWTGNNPAMGQGTLTSQGITDLSYKLVFLANNVVVNQVWFQKENNIDNFEQFIFDQNQDEADFLNKYSDSDLQEIDRIKNETNLFDKIASLIAPSVLENQQVKKGIVLMLFGGVNKKTADGMKIRGDINLCLVGDPATAKSQFLKFVYNYIPWTIYTSGKGSSAAGLTASLSKDPDTGDFTLEAGALMLADNGICCIDEFDKMQERDSVAIHEAMEQQTISITKAGIQATLNARCSILAAMNPIMGRYDKTKNLKSNIRLSPPLMSRFDIFFVMTDDCWEQIDMAIAKRIVSLHKDHNAHEELFGQSNPTQVLSHSSLLRYLQFAWQIKPKITPEAKKLLIKVYQRMRTNEFQIQKNAYWITVRQLESLIRLSEACARVHCSFEVNEFHVEQAVSLLNNSIIKIDQSDYTVTIDDAMIEEAAYVHQQQQQAAQQQIEETKDPVPKQNFQMNKQEYKKISQNLIQCLKRILREDSNAKVTVEMLALQLVEQQIQEFKDLEQVAKFEKIIKGVIKRMATKERVFQINQDERDQEVIRFHPGVNLNDF